MFDYQLDRHCSKTIRDEMVKTDLFDYQLDRHCSKTEVPPTKNQTSLITS